MRTISLAVAMAVVIGGSSLAWAEESKSAACDTKVCAAAPAAAQAAEGTSAPAAPAEKAPMQAAPAEPAAVAAPAEKIAKPTAAEETTVASGEGSEVLEASIATGMENRQPVGAGETFPASVGKLYCYTKIAGGQEGGEVVHKWMKGGEPMAEVTLKLGGSPWRVYSSKIIVPEATGKWSVDVMQDGKVLKTLEFTVE
jgi:hypothetical protein